jgi:hypothetical protein
MGLLERTETMVVSITSLTITNIATQVTFSYKCDKIGQLQIIHKFDKNITFKYQIKFYTFPSNLMTHIQAILLVSG